MLYFCRMTIESLNCAQNDYVGQNYQNEAVLGLCDEDVSILFEDTSSCIYDL